ncbi:MAG TPA: hypothetical protein VGD46_19420, partial [Rhizobacter sp.]
MAGGAKANNVATLLKGFEKDYKAAVGVMGVRDDEPTRLPTGMFTLDLLTGGGLPEGRVTVIYGPESSMKTTLCLKAVASAQRRYPDRTAAFIDIEGHLDRKWAAKMGVDVDKLAHIIPQNAEQAVDIAEALLHAEDVSIIIFDSLAALQVQAELEKSAEDSTPGKQALVINRFYRKVTHALNDARVKGDGFMPTLVAVNQYRFKIGASKYEDPEVMPGGPAFKFISSLTLRVKGYDVIQKPIHKGLPAYKRIAFSIKKNKVPIVAKSGEMFIALLPIPEFNLQVGELYSWGTVLQYLKTLGLIVKT